MSMSMSMGTGSSSSGVHNVFVYGSLLVDDVVRVLLKRVPQSSPAILHNFHRYSVKGRVYPAILPVDEKTVTGRVLMGISPPELDIIDCFEDYEYKRKTVHVSFLDSSETMDAHTYIWADANDPDLYGEWDFQRWKQEHMDDFLKMTIDFVDELNHPHFQSRVATYENMFVKQEDPHNPPSS